MAHRKVALEWRGDVAVLTLTEPETINAMSVQMLEDLERSISDAASRGRAMILTGAGRAFCTGAGLRVANRSEDAASHLVMRSI